MRGSLNQLHLFRLDSCDAHALDPAVGGVENLELQAFVFDDFAFFRNASGDFADQAGYSRRFVALWAHAEEFVEAINVHIAGNNIGVVVLLDDLRFFVLVSDFADDFFHQIFDGYQARNASVFINHDCHTGVAPLHLAQQVAD